MLVFSVFDKGVGRLMGEVAVIDVYEVEMVDS